MTYRVGPKFETYMEKAFALAKGDIQDIVFQEIVRVQIAHGDLAEVEKNKHGIPRNKREISYEIASQYALKKNLSKALELMGPEIQVEERVSLMILAGEVEAAMTELRKENNQLSLDQFLFTKVDWKQFESHQGMGEQMVAWVPRGDWRHYWVALAVLGLCKDDISAKLDELEPAIKIFKEDEAETLHRSYYLLKAKIGHFEAAFAHAKKNPLLMADLMDRAVAKKGAEVERHLGVCPQLFVLEKFISELARQGLHESARKAEQQYQKRSYCSGRSPYSPLLKGLVQGKHYSMAIEVFKDTPKSEINIRWGLEALIATRKYADAEKLISTTAPLVQPAFQARCWTRLAYAVRQTS